NAEMKSERTPIRIRNSQERRASERQSEDEKENKPGGKALECKHRRWRTQTFQKRSAVRPLPLPVPGGIGRRDPSERNMDQRKNRRAQNHSNGRQRLRSQRLDNDRLQGHHIGHERNLDNLGNQIATEQRLYFPVAERHRGAGGERRL